MKLMDKCRRDGVCMQVHVEVLTASPEANGFFGSQGVSGLIPAAYTMLEQNTWARLNKQWSDAQGKQGLLGLTDKRLQEYKRPGWEFHAKGIW